MDSLTDSTMRLKSNLISDYGATFFHFDLKFNQMTICCLII